MSEHKPDAIVPFVEAVDELRVQDQSFIAAYLMHGHSHRAYLDAGFSDGPRARQHAYDLRHRPDIKAAITAGLRARAETFGRDLKAYAEKFTLDAAAVVYETTQLAMADIGGAFDADDNLIPLAQMPAEVRKTISSYKVTFSKDGDKTIEVKFTDKTANLANAARILGMFKDKTEVSTTDAFAQMVLNAARIRAEKKAAAAKTEE